MIHILVKRRDGAPVSVIASGHAGEQGSSVICAAVSALMIGLGNGLEKIAQIPNLVFESPEDGYLRIILPDNLDEAHQKRAAILLDTLILALSDIAEDAPDDIIINNICE